MTRGKGTGVTPKRVRELVAEAVARESQYAVAKKSGLALSVIQGVLRGDREPTTGTLHKLAKYLGVSVPELRGEVVILDGELFEGLTEERKALVINIAKLINGPEVGQDYYCLFNKLVSIATSENLSRIAKVLDKLS